MYNPLPVAGLTSEVRSHVSSEGSPTRILLRLAAPTVGAMLAQSVVNEIDILFFAHLPCPESSNAQAALLPSLIVLWLFGGSLSGISVGTQTITSRRFAEGRHEDAGAAVVTATLFALVAGTVFCLLGYLVMPSLLHAIVRVPGAYDAAREYLGWRLFGVMSMAATFALKAFFDGIGKTHIHLVASVAMNAVNILLCWLLIFGNAGLGIPKMGMGGAGLAGVVSTYVGMFIMLGYLLNASHRKQFALLSFRRIDRGVLGRILRLSIPGGVATIAVMTGFMLFALIASKLDELFPRGMASAMCPGGQSEPVASASTTVIVGIIKLTFTACLAFGTSTATLVSQSLGRGEPDRASLFGWTSVRLGLIIFGVVGIVEAVFAPQILHVAAQSDLVREAALNPLRLMGILTPVIATAMILTQALFGAGNTKFVMLVELLLHFTCLVPLAWVLGIVLGWGLVGIWLAASIYVVVLAAIMVWKFRSGDWKNIAV